MSVRTVGAGLAFATLYALAYVRCYVSFLYRYFEYVGYDLFHRESLFLVLAVAIAVLPVVAFRGVRAVSSAIAVLVYLILYVPIILTFALGSGKPTDEILTLQLTFMLGMVLLFAADWLVIRNPFNLDLGIELMPIVLGVTIAASAYVLFVYRGNLHFSTFGEELYTQRAENESLGADLLTRYLTSWLATVLIPLCLAYGFSTRRRRYTISGSVSCLILYMAAANKLLILLPFVYLGFYLLLRRRLRAMLPVMAASLTVAITALVALAAPGTVLFIAAAIVLNRTIGNGGQLTMAYYDFFTFYQQTGFSHVKGLNLFSRPYPYGGLQVGQVVGQFYWSPFMNANANFWATDGIASMGLPGVAVISVVAALLLVVINSVTQRYNPLFAVLAFVPFVMTLLNQSLFSSFWSGGGFFLILFFAFNRQRTATTAARAARSSSAVAPA